MRFKLKKIPFFFISMQNGEFGRKSNYSRKSGWISSKAFIILKRTGNEGVVRTFSTRDNNPLLILDLIATSTNFKSLPSLSSFIRFPTKLITFSCIMFANNRLELIPFYPS